MLRKEAGLFTSEVLSVAAESWDINEGASIGYVQKVTGIAKPTSLNLLSISLSGVTEADFRSNGDAAASDRVNRFYELSNDAKLSEMLRPTTIQSRCTKFMILRSASLDGQLSDLLSAPSFSIGTNRVILNHSAGSYRTAASFIQYVFLLLFECIAHDNFVRVGQRSQLTQTT